MGLIMKYKPEIADNIAQYISSVDINPDEKLNCVSFATNYYKQLYGRDLLQEILVEYGLEHIDLNDHLMLLQAYITCRGQSGRIDFLKRQGFNQLDNNLLATRGDVVLITDVPNIGLVCDGKVYVYSALGLSHSQLKADKRFMVFTLKDIN